MEDANVALCDFHGQLSDLGSALKKLEPKVDSLSTRGGMGFYKVRLSRYSLVGNRRYRWVCGLSLTGGSTKIARDGVDMDFCLSGEMRGGLSEGVKAIADVAEI